MKRFECAAVLFDLDGVLVDSTALVEQQWRRWAVARGLQPEPFLRVCHGRRAVETIRMAAPELDAEAEVRAFAPSDEDSEAVKPLDGASRLLGELPDGTWAVATSGPRALATDRLRQVGLPTPAVFVCAEDVACGKPSPEAYALAASRLGVPAAECLVFEDAPAGIDAARAAGMAVVGLTTTHPADQLPADARVPTLAAVHLGRVGRDHSGRPSLEFLIVED
ncbi:MAG: HAD-IA family hydrolase [Gemmatimonadales bacterium]